MTVKITELLVNISGFGAETINAQVRKFSLPYPRLLRASNIMQLSVSSL